MIILMTMRRKSNKYLLVITLMSLWYNHTLAQQQPLRSVDNASDSLLLYTEIAIRQNPGVMQKYEEYKASLERIPQAGSLPDPELSAGILLTPMELLMGNQLAEVSLMQMFPWFGVLQYAKDEMSMMSKADYEEFKDAKLQVIYNVQKNWYELYSLEKNISFSEKNIQILRTIERLSLAAYRSASPGGTSAPTGSTSMGTGVPGSGASNVPGSSGGMSMGSSNSATSSSVSGISSGANQQMQTGGMSGNSTGTGLADLYRIQIEIGELENSILLLENQKIAAFAKFNALLNRPPLAPVYLPDTIFADSLPMNLSNLSDSLLSGNPMLTMLKYEQQSIQARKEMNRRMGLPMIGIGLNYSVLGKSEMSESEMNGRDMIMPMVRITLPVYRKNYRALQNEAEALNMASGFAYKSAANNLVTEYFEAMQLYQDAGKKNQTIRKPGTVSQPFTGNHDQELFRLFKSVIRCAKC